jgi:hypothetical protein
VFTTGMVHKYMVSHLFNTKVGWKVFPPAKLKVKEGRYLSETKKINVPLTFIYNCA